MKLLNHSQTSTVAKKICKSISNRWVPVTKMQWWSCDVIIMYIYIITVFYVVLNGDRKYCFRKRPNKYGLNSWSLVQYIYLFVVIITKHVDIGVLYGKK